MDSKASSDALKQITHLAAAFKAPRITDTAARLADHARDAGRTFQDYLSAVLDREVSAATPPALNCGSVPRGSVAAKRSTS